MTIDSVTPERIACVSQTQFSIARHYGGLRINGQYYHYVAATDMIIRDDVLRRERAAQREQAKADNHAKLEGLFDGFI